MNSPPGLLHWTNNINVHGYWGLYDDFDSMGSTNGAVPLDYPQRNIGADIIITTETGACQPGGSGNCGQTEWTGAAPGCVSCWFPSSFASVFNNYPADLTVRAPYAGAGQFGTDPGADIQVVGWSTQGAASGAPNSYLDFRVRSLRLSPGTANFVYTAPDTGACTLTVANNSAYSSPVYSGGDGGGNPDRDMTVSGLTGNTRYWWELVCGTSSYRRSGTLLTH
jgi:hypothetical protein